MEIEFDIDVGISCPRVLRFSQIWDGKLGLVPLPVHDPYCLALKLQYVTCILRRAAMLDCPT